MPVGESPRARRAGVEESRGGRVMLITEARHEE